MFKILFECHASGPSDNYNNLRDRVERPPPFLYSQPDLSDSCLDRNHMKVSSFNTHQRLLHGIIRPAGTGAGSSDVMKKRFRLRVEDMTERWKELKKKETPTLHIEVTVEIGWSVAVEQSHSATGHFFIRIHHPVMFVVTVSILWKKKNSQSNYFT